METREKLWSWGCCRIGVTTGGKGQRITEYLKLEGSHEVRWVQLLEEVEHILLGLYISRCLGWIWQMRIMAWGCSWLMEIFPHAKPSTENHPLKGWVLLTKPRYCWASRSRQHREISVLSSGRKPGGIPRATGDLKSLTCGATTPI